MPSETPLARVLERLPGVRQTGAGYSAHCPAHDDRSASLSVTDGDDGRVLLHCHAGCAVEAIVAAMGLEVRDLFPPRDGRRPARVKTKRSATVEDFGAPTPKQVAALVRSRRICKASDLEAAGARLVRAWAKAWLGFRTVAGSWKLWALDNKGHPRLDEGLRLIRCNVGPVSLVCSPSVREAFATDGTIARLYDVEGESDLMASLGTGLEYVIASTGGAGTLDAHERHREQLAALKLDEVVIVRDLDDAGRKGAQKAATWWHALGVKVRMPTLPEALGDGGDLRDFLLGRPALNGKPEMPPFGTVADLERLAAEAQAWTAGVDGTAAAHDVDADCGGGDGDETHEKKSRGPCVAAQLVTVVSEAEAELFHAPDGTPFATIVNDGHAETYPLRSRDFRSWMEHLFYQRTQKAPNPAAVQAALGVLTGRARFDGVEHPVFTRTGEHGGVIYLDLADADWTAVAITPAGWQLMVNPPVKFRRARGMLALPPPVGGAPIDTLRPFVNVATDDDFVLLVAWLVASLRPRGPFPVLALHGEQGSAKSTTAKVLRAAVDPNVAALRATPRDPRDLMIAATNGLIIALDNLSHLAPWFSDCLCRLATGGGFATRELFTDAEEVLFDATRPVMVNGIEEIATRGDLLDRAIVLELPMIGEDRRRAEEDFWREYDAARPAILGALLDALSAALRELPHTQLDRLPRMADFALWITAAEPALGWKPQTFLTAYLRNRGEAHELTLDASLVARTLRRFVDSRSHPWEGTATDLHRELAASLDEQQRTDRAWPRSGRGLTSHLTRLAPSLRAIGLSIDRARKPGGERTRLITITKAPPQPSRPSRDDAKTSESRTPARDDRGTVGTIAGRSRDGTGRVESAAISPARDGRDGRDGRMQTPSSDAEVDL
jgi:hypothetical protein